MRAVAGFCLTLLLAACLPGQGSAPPPQNLRFTPGETAMRLGLPAHGVEINMKHAGDNGPVRNWLSADNYTVSEHKGVVVATRGFGFDLMAADPGPTLSAIASGSNEIYSRRMRYLTADNHSTWLQAGCKMTEAGSDKGLRRFDESCEARGNKFTNSYWVGPEGTIRSTRQWISTGTGTMVLSWIRM
ncbi:YjbF family lipoprotein [Pseudogemmobacter bohemicus]|uniref:YjbF family lipoprotein n=1 Tax=Pseudogemmobacter bohemicus TaxID=2250708 RepID=UPI0013004F81|nr:YjbF family lipoprotein [Pseudogemmobacter bohemicus]